MLYLIRHTPPPFERRLLARHSHEQHSSTLMLPQASYPNLKSGLMGSYPEIRINPGGAPTSGRFSLPDVPEPNRPVRR